jgi:hypothetical protein
MVGSPLIWLSSSIALGLDAEKAASRDHGIKVRYGAVDCDAARGGEGEDAMRILRSVAVWLVAVGLSIGAAGVAWGQGGTGGGTGQRSGGMSGSGSMSGGGMSGSGSLSGAGQPPSGQPTTGLPPIQSSPGGPSIGGTSMDDAADVRNPRTDADMEKLRNLERQKKLVADTERLLSLATELKTDMDKTTKDTLSLDVVRKADEIEKLAHSVKERMKGQ